MATKKRVVKKPMVLGNYDLIRIVCALQMDIDIRNQRAEAGKEPMWKEPNFHSQNLIDAIKTYLDWKE